MTRIQISVGKRFQYRNKIWEIQKHLMGDKFLVSDLSFGTEEYFTAEQIAEAMFEGDLMFEVFGRNTEKAKQGLTTEYKFGDISELKEMYKQIASERLFIIKPLLDMPKTKEDVENRIKEVKEFTGKIDGEREFVIYKNKVISQATVYRWIKEYEASERDIRALVPGYYNCGGPTKSRLQEEVDQIIAEVIAGEYLIPERPTITEISYTIKDRINSANKIKERTGQELLKEPSFGTICKKIQRIDEFKRIEARYGKKVAKNRFKGTNTGKESDVTRALEVTYIDHTRLDLFLVDEDDRLPIGRPILTFMIDKYSRMPLGFYVGFDAASFRTVGECMYHSILNKNYVSKIFPSIKGQWPAWGLPETVIVDNGKEFHSNGLKDACLQLGICLEYARPRVAEDKAIIERYFRIINEKLLHSLPGTTFSNISQRGDYDPKKNAIISIQEFEKILHAFIIGYIHMGRQQLGGHSPVKVWMDSVKKHPQSLPHSRKELKTLLGNTEKRMLRSSGIEFEGMFYNDSAELAMLRTIIGNSEVEVKFKYNPNDLSVIFVWDHLNEKYIEVKNNNQRYSKNLSLWKHKKIKKFARDNNIESGYEGYLIARKIIEGIVEEGWAKSKKTKTRTTLARFKGIEGGLYNLIRGIDDEDIFCGEDQKKQDEEITDVDTVEVLDIVESSQKDDKKETNKKNTNNQNKKKNEKTKSEVELETDFSLNDWNGWK